MFNNFREKRHNHCWKIYQLLTGFFNWRIHFLSTHHLYTDSLKLRCKINNWIKILLEFIIISLPAGFETTNSFSHKTWTRESPTKKAVTFLFKSMNKWRKRNTFFFYRWTRQALVSTKSKINTRNWYYY